VEKTSFVNIGQPPQNAEYDKLNLQLTEPSITLPPFLDQVVQICLQQLKEQVQLLCNIAPYDLFELDYI
jgi:hypothetical protein